MITRRSLVLAIAASVTTYPLAVTAQSPGRAHRVGALWGGPATSSQVVAFKHELRNLGYVEGQNVVFLERSLSGDPAHISELVAELLKLKVDVLITTSTRAAQAAAKLTSSTPIIVASAGDLIGAGLAASHSKPGGNVTGLASFSPELSAKRLELLQEIVPGLRRVAVLWNPDGPAPVRAFKEIQSASRILALEIQSLEVRAPDDLERAFAAFARGGAQAMLVILDPLIGGNAERIARLAVSGRVPAIFPTPEFVVAGGLIAYGPNVVARFRRTAHFVDRILKGAKASDLPIEQPTTFELIVNAKTATALGLSVPKSVLLRADTVIK
jgi:putative ABC transport system substrate-binding protein